MHKLKVAVWMVFIALALWGGFMKWDSSFIGNQNALLAGINEPVAFLQEPAQRPQELQPEEQEVAVVPEVLGDQNIIEPSESNQDNIDAILEEIDLLQRQIQDLQAAQLALEEPEEELVLEEEVAIEEDIILAAAEEPAQVSYNNGGSNAVYPKILISEVQIGGMGDTKQEFVELYNPEAEEVDLGGWYLQRKTKSADNFSTFASKTLFEGKKIPAHGYFLIARTGSAFRTDIVVDNPLTEDNTLALKNPNGDISDKVGFGQAGDYELLAALNPPAGQSIGRKIVAGAPFDTDNNESDFEANTPTPRAQNSVYTTPVLETLPAPVDDLAPEVYFTLDAIQKSLDFAIQFEITDPIGTVSPTLSGAGTLSVPPSGMGSYMFRWQQEGGIWEEGLEQTVSSAGNAAVFTRDFSGQDETVYYFQVKAKDVAGNESVWLPVAPATTKISLFKKIVINEVQTEGATVKDEFIELYNPNDVDVNLENFALKKKTSGGTESNLISKSAFSGIIKAGGYFLVAPQDNDDGTKNYTGTAEPDARYSGASFSIAAGNTILLYNSEDELLDSGVVEDLMRDPATPQNSQYAPPVEPELPAPPPPEEPA